MLPRRLRRTIASAGAVVALLALPPTALAFPQFATSTLASTGPYVSGGVATYTLTLVNTGSAPAVAGSVTVMAGDWPASAPATVVGTPVVTDGPTPGNFDGSDVTVDAGSNSIGINTSFDTGDDVTVTFQLRLPRSHSDAYVVRAEVAVDGTGIALEDDWRTVTKGGPSVLAFDLAASPRSTTKDSTFHGSITVTNRGSGQADFPRVTIGATGVGSEFSPWWGTNPAFSPNLTFVSGCEIANGAECEIGPLPAGARRVLGFEVSSLTHLGSVWLFAQGSTADRTWNGTAERGFFVTDGTRSATRVALSGPSTGSAGTDVRYRGEVVNAGPDPVRDGLLIVSTSQRIDDPATESIRSITLSTGASCAPQQDRGEPPYTSPTPNAWACPIAALSVGQRMSFDVVANFSLASNEATVTASVETRGEPALTGTSATVTTQVNPDRTVDLQLATSAVARIGAGRSAPVTVVVRNVGTSTASGVTIAGSIGGVGGAFDPGSMPASCIGATKPQYVTCEMEPIASGASATLTLKVRAGTAKGPLTVSFAASWMRDSRAVADANPDDDSQVAVLDVVKADAVVLEGVTVSKPVASTTGKLVKNGVASTVTCPTSCRVTGTLTVPRPLALRLGLVKGGKSGRAKAATVTLGSATTSRTAAGKVVVTIKLAKAFRTKVRSLGSALNVTRTLTVVSTDPDTKDATYRTTGTIRFRPGR